jgi:hypothetical protein
MAIAAGKLTVEAAGAARKVLREGSRGDAEGTKAQARVRGTEKRDDGHADAARNVHRRGIGADQEIKLPDGRDEARQAKLARSDDAAIAQPVREGARQAHVFVCTQNKHAHAVPRAEGLDDTAPSLERPTLRRPSRRRVDTDQTPARPVTSCGEPGPDVRSGHGVHDQPRTPKVLRGIDSRQRCEIAGDYGRELDPPTQETCAQAAGDRVLSDAAAGNPGPPCCECAAARRSVEI